MVKVHKMFCIERNVSDFLKGRNASELVNRLLEEHMAHEDIEGMSADELRKNIKIEELKKETELKIEELRKHG